ncbi:MAG: penicillin-binding transpeptidase domain-containing protein [Armatimonadota bacterium]|nr:penicillin-binding transpeptidase domain-containing protein [Armatimonadota bacterium]
MDHDRLIKRRLLWLFCLYFLLWAGIFVRLVDLQVLRAGELQQLASQQKFITLRIEASRGRILDRQGRELAVNGEAPSIYAVPRNIEDPKAFAETVAPILKVSPRAVLERLRQGEYFVWLARRVSAETAGRMERLGLKNEIGFLRESRRVYPKGSLAAHILGFTGVDNQGLSGIELFYDHILRGQPGEAIAERDGRGRILVETQRLVKAPVDGATLILTMDEVIQYISERELDAAIKRTGAKRGAILAMDPQSGEILAMAVWPRYNPNFYERASPEVWAPWPVTEVYEPGSTLKPVLAASALEAKVITPESVFICQGSLPVEGGYVIRDALGKRHGAQRIREILKNSCNVGAAQVATKLGKEAYYTYLRKFGFGNPTGIDLPGEAAGILPPPERWLGPTLQTAAFGQGISTTAVQLLAAVSALANGGFLVRPHIVRVIRDSEGKVVKAVGPERVRQVVSAQTARLVLSMLEDVVEEGTGTGAQVKGYRVAGKTGTAQKPSPYGGYDPDRYVASFLGIVPVEDPRLAVLVILDEPRGEYLGGVVAAPLFREVARQVLWYLKVPPHGAEERRDRG